MMQLAPLLTTYMEIISILHAFKKHITIAMITSTKENMQYFIGENGKDGEKEGKFIKSGVSIAIKNMRKET